MAKRPLAGQASPSKKSVQRIKTKLGELLMPRNKGAWRCAILFAARAITDQNPIIATGREHVEGGASTMGLLCSRKRLPIRPFMSTRLRTPASLPITLDSRARD